MQLPPHSNDNGNEDQQPDTLTSETGIAATTAVAVSPPPPICAICLAPFRGRVYLSPCFHSFCAACISEWLDITVLCPLCKTKPVKILWGVDTTLGILNAILVSDTKNISSTSSSSLASGSMAGATTLSRSPIGTPVVAPGTGRYMSETDPWKVALRKVAQEAESKEIESDQKWQEHHQQRQVDDVNENHADNADDSTLDDTGSLSSPTPVTGTGSSSVGAFHGKRGRATETQVPNKRTRSMSESRSKSRSRSRSRSVTPIDSYRLLYDTSESSSHMDSTTSAHTLDTPHADQQLELQDETPPTRREIYTLGMEPYPPTDFPLADRILPTDMILLAPFLERDLAVLTDTDPDPVDPIVLAHISTLLMTHGGKGDWEQIETEVAQWITLSSSNHRTTERLMAQLFVQEMRRVVKRRWKIGQWSSRVVYKDTTVATVATAAS